ncbi:hypothetical protein IPM19_03050 [bacterium]|nr:MAG: hypothetical protein IPM19_03050 [bacterium]
MTTDFDLDKYLEESEMGLKSNSVHIRNFMDKLRASYGTGYWLLMEREEFTESEQSYGKRLVKMALYDIRRGLETGSPRNAKLQNFHVIRLFGCPEHVREVLNLRGFTALWDHHDRSYRSSIFKFLEKNATKADLPQLEEFHARLNQIDYAANERVDPELEGEFENEFDFALSFDDPYERRTTPNELSGFDQQDMRRVLDAISGY